MLYVPGCHAPWQRATPRSSKAPQINHNRVAARDIQAARGSTISAISTISGLRGRSARGEQRGVETGSPMQRSDKTQADARYTGPDRADKGLDAMRRKQTLMLGDGDAV